MRDKPLDLSYDEPVFDDTPKLIDFTLHGSIAPHEQQEALEMLKLGQLKFTPGLQLVEWLNDYATKTNDGRPRFKFSLEDGAIPTVTITKAF